MILDGFAGIRSLLKGNVSDFFAITKAQWHFLFHLRKWKKRRKDNEHFLFDNMNGVYRGSIVWDYFVKKKRRFSQIMDHH